MTRDLECAVRAKRRRRFRSIYPIADTQVITGNDDPKQCRRFARPAHSKSIPALVCALFIIGYASVPTGAAPQKRAQRTRIQKPKTPSKPKIDYTKFSHQTHVVAQKLACNSCHKVPSKNWKEMRKGDAAFADVTDFPEHSSC